MLEKGFDLRNTVEILNIEERIPKDHLLRKIDSAVDFSHIYDIVGDLYSADKGRKSVDPVVLFKIVLIQHLYGIPSLRQTIREIDMNMAYRRFWATTSARKYHTLPRSAMRLPNAMTAEW